MYRIKKQEMRKHLTIAIMLLNFMSLIAQQNLLSDLELFDQIKIEGTSLGDIMTTHGNLNQLKAYFGDSLIEKQDNSAPHPSKFIFNSDISLGFEDEENNGEFDLSWIAIRSNLISISVKGTTLKLGSLKSDLKYYDFNSNASSFVFTDADTGSVSLNFKIGKDDKITEILFISEN